ncbi:hypothetical protein DPMN_180172 [Dreissena polymorpha]|uniref:Uncharacterized protein n=1 Tax=Dreissena polymorpha TaxID=45954 RepID=A0A9D4IN04_DREPO|nr:hypothetical protein DPMN_180172 [Dreissena polymorpha]
MMWTDARGLSAQGIDMTLAIVVYNGYRAYFASKHPEEAERAQSYLRDIASVVDLCASPFLRLVSYMFHHYSYRWLCSNRARSSNGTGNAADLEKESAVQMFDLAVMGVKSEFGTNTDLQQFVTGWSLVNKLLCYLMITNQFVVTTDQGIKTTSIALARKYIDVLQRRLSGLTLRQKVKYYLCQARMCEYEKDMESAASYMREVLTLLTEAAGAFCKVDIDNIRKYHDFVLRLSLPVPNTGTCRSRF